MSERIKRGKEGEHLAEEFLNAKGFRTVTRNYRCRRSEIDLIVERDDWLIFVEVKTRSSCAYGYPEEFVDPKQRKKIIDGALQYMFDADWQGNVRYDIVSVDLSRGDPEVRHIEDAFY